MSTWLRALYGYHAWANSDLNDKLEMLDQPSQGRDRHTAIRLINHSYVVAQIFAAHLRGTTHHYEAAGTAETPTLSELRAAVTASDQWYLNYVQSPSPSNLSGSVPFTFTDGDKGYMTERRCLLTLRCTEDIIAAKLAAYSLSTPSRHRTTRSLSTFIRPIRRADSRVASAQRWTSRPGTARRRTSRRRSPRRRPRRPGRRPWRRCRPGFAAGCAASTRPGRTTSGAPPSGR